MALKIQKELEMKLHKEFYNNVYVLTLEYQPCQAFAEVFKKNMFVKNNKVGSQQAIYYLLEILDKNNLKQRIKTWPLYDNRGEFEFRKEIVKYFNELNTIYEDAGIPNITTSHLISPGGFKFIKFMFQLSQFVLYTHMKRNPDLFPNLLLPLKASKEESVTKQNIDNMNRVANNINKSTCVLKEDFENNYETAIKESKSLMQEVCSTNMLIEEHKAKLEVLKEQASNIDEDSTTSEELLQKLQTLQLLKEKFQQCQLLCSYLENPLKLEYDKERDILEDQLNRIRIDGDNLDLRNLFESFIVLLNSRCLEIKPLNKENLQMEVDRFAKLNERLEAMLKNVRVIYKEALVLTDKLKKESRRKTNKNEIFKKSLDVDSDSDLELAVPLSDSI